MSTSESSQARTRMFSRVIGPFLVIVTATAVVRAPDQLRQISEAAPTPLWTWVSGAFTLLAGLIVVAFHPYWRGAAAIGVSITGWLTTLKGLFLVTFPETSMSVAQDALGAASLWQVTYFVFILLGLYLTYVGWAPARNRVEPQPVSSTEDLPG